MLVLRWTGGTNTRGLSGRVDLKVLFIYDSYFFRLVVDMIVIDCIQCLSYSCQRVNMPSNIIVIILGKST